MCVIAAVVVAGIAVIVNVVVLMAVVVVVVVAGIVVIVNVVVVIAVVVVVVTATGRLFFFFSIFS